MRERTTDSPLRRDCLLGSRTGRRRRRRGRTRFGGRASESDEDGGRFVPDKLELLALRQHVLQRSATAADWQLTHLLPVLSRHTEEQRQEGGREGGERKKHFWYNFGQDKLCMYKHKSQWLKLNLATVWQFFYAHVYTAHDTVPSAKTVDFPLLHSLANISVMQ